MVATLAALLSIFQQDAYEKVTSYYLAKGISVRHAPNPIAPSTIGSEKTILDDEATFAVLRAEAKYETDGVKRGMKEGAGWDSKVETERMLVDLRGIESDASESFQEIEIRLRTFDGGMQDVLVYAPISMRGRQFARLVFAAWANNSGIEIRTTSDTRLVHMLREEASHGDGSIQDLAKSSEVALETLVCRKPRIHEICAPWEYVVGASAQDPVRFMFPSDCVNFSDMLREYMSDELESVSVFCGEYDMRVAIHGDEAEYSLLVRGGSTPVLEISVNLNGGKRVSRVTSFDGPEQLMLFSETLSVGQAVAKIIVSEASGEVRTIGELEQLSSEFTWLKQDVTWNDLQHFVSISPTFMRNSTRLTTPLHLRRSS